MRFPLLGAAVAALLFAVGASGADSTMQKVGETSTTITFKYAAAAGAGGYRYYADGVAVARTFNPDQLTVKFSKGPGSYRVAPLDVSERPDGYVYPDQDPPSPPPPATITSAECTARASTPGAVIANVTVTGGCTVNAANVTIKDSALSGTVTFNPGATGAKLLRSTGQGFDLFGADDVLIEGNRFDGQGRDNQNLIWDQPAGNVPERFVIRGNTFTRFYIDDGTTHSEALYVGYSKDGLIEGNTFTDNGNTAHIFFTWFGNTANPATSYPRNVCVRANTFNQTHGAYFDVNLREEIPTSAGIRVQADASITNRAFSGSC